MTKYQSGERTQQQNIDMAFRLVAGKSYDDAMSIAISCPRTGRQK